MQRPLKTMERARVAIYGSLPPPFGGVSVHLNRIIERLREEGIPFCLYEQRGKSIPERNVVASGRKLLRFVHFLLCVREPIVHFHTSKVSAIVTALVVLQLRRRKVILTFHSERLMRFYRTSTRLTQLAFTFCLSKVHHACLLYTSPSPRDLSTSRMPSSA